MSLLPPECTQCGGRGIIGLDAPRETLPAVRHCELCGAMGRVWLRRLPGQTPLPGRTEAGCYCPDVDAKRCAEGRKRPRAWCTNGRCDCECHAPSGAGKGREDEAPTHHHGDGPHRGHA